MARSFRFELSSFWPSTVSPAFIREFLIAIALLAACSQSAPAASLTLRWDPPNDSSTIGYIVYYGTLPQSYTVHLDVGMVTERRVDGLQDGTNYCFAVRAYNSAGDLSARSTEVCGTTPAAVTDGSSGSGDPPNGGGSGGATTDPTDIVLHASMATVIRGNWAAVPSAGAAGGQSMVSRDDGWSSPDVPRASPASYFELPFNAVANMPYRVWLRMRAGANSKWNDAVWVQFSNSLARGVAAYRIGTSSGLLVNLAACFDCATSGWGWQNTAYWLKQTTAVTFATTGTHKIRVQIREDGVEVDQIVLSPTTYFTAAPGAQKNDATTLPDTGPVPEGRDTGAAPYGGASATLPGTIEAAHFDEGGAGVAYYDTTSANLGGVFRSTGVDLQPAAGGGYNVGWSAAGEWMAYTVNVASAGSYIAQLRVASIGGGSMELAFGAPSSATASFMVPHTGAWQTWTTVKVPLTLAAGEQRMMVRFKTPNVNFRSMSLVSNTVPAPSTPYGGTPATVPGVIDAVRFDTGMAGASYSDTTAGNAGGMFRATDVDIQRNAVGGYNVGWAAPGEWLAYTVKVGTSGSYVAHFLVASVGGGSMQVDFGAPSSATARIAIPDTGGWQAWTIVSVPLALSAGQQRMTVHFNTANVNFSLVSIEAMR